MPSPGIDSDLGWSSSHRERADRTLPVRGGGAAARIESSDHRRRHCIPVTIAAATAGAVMYASAAASDRVTPVSTQLPFPAGDCMFFKVWIYFQVNKS